jgi:hypothetical protein
MVKAASQRAGELAFDILRNEFHLPIVDGKINIENIEDKITLGIYTGDLVGITQEIVDLAVSTIEDLVKVYAKK